MTITDQIIFNIIAMSFFLTFSQTLFLSFSYSYYCFNQPQISTNSILYFRLGSLLSNENIFTFLRALKAEISSCVLDGTRDALLSKHSSSKHMQIKQRRCSCGSVVEHCVSSTKGSIPKEHTYKTCITWMHCKSLWIKASAKCINVNVKQSLDIQI